MLIENFENKTVAIKLTTGDELIAKLVKSTEDTVDLYKPLSVMMSPTPQGINVLMFPWIAGIGEDETVTLNKQFIVVIHKALKSMEDNYQAQTSKIKPVKSSIITG